MRTILSFAAIILFLLFGYILLGVFWIYGKINKEAVKKMFQQTKLKKSIILDMTLSPAESIMVHGLSPLREKQNLQIVNMTRLKKYTLYGFAPILQIMQKIQ